MQISRFQTIWFPLTYKCNNRCSWCYVPSEKSYSCDKVYGDETEKKYISLMSDLGVKRIILIGGEPTLYSSIERAIGRIKNVGIIPTMVSNGRKISDKGFLKNLISAGLNSLTISLEGSNPTVHDGITKVPGSFYETVMGIENALEENFPVATETTISHENKGDLENLVRHLEKYSLSSRIFNICGPCLSDLKNSNHTMSLNEGAEIFERLYAVAERKNIKLITPVPVCSFDPQKYKEMVRTKSISHGCHLLFGHNFVLEANGDILPCVHFSNYPIFNINKNGRTMTANEFLEEYNSPNGANQQFRQSLGRYPSEKCAKGDCWDPCTGGCTAFWLKYNASKEIKGKGSTI